MATPTAPPAAAPAPHAPLRRDPVRGKVGGVAAGLAGRLGIDPLAVRLAFVLATAAGGWGAALYLLLWVAIPPGDGTATSTRFRTGRASVEVALGAALLLLAACSSRARPGCGSPTRSSGRWCSWPAAPR